MGEPAAELWIFGYGSLMWRPDFPFQEAHLARLDGWHRRFCIVSRYYRGTDKRPGLVLGLDRGGSCQGRAFCVAAEHGLRVVTYLRMREQISGVYQEAHLNVLLLDGSHRTVKAVTFVAEPAHPSFIRPLPLGAEAAIVAGANGSTGTNLEYLIATLEHLRAFGIRERGLERLLSVIGPVRGRGGRGKVRSPVGGYAMSVWPRRPVRKLADVKRFMHRRRMGLRME